MLSLLVLSASFYVISARDVLSGWQTLSGRLTSDEMCLRNFPDAWDRYIYFNQEFWPVLSDASSSIDQPYNSAMTTCRIRDKTGAVDKLAAWYTEQLQCPLYTFLQIVSGLKMTNVDHKVTKAFCISPVNGVTETSAPIVERSGQCVKLVTENSKQGIVGWATVLTSSPSGGGLISQRTQLASFTVYLVRQGKNDLYLRKEFEVGGIEWYPKTWQEGDAFKICASNGFNRKATLRAALVDSWIDAL